jgi:hypothetical protein
MSLSAYSLHIFRLTAMQRSTTHLETAAIRMIVMLMNLTKKSGEPNAPKIDLST